MSKDTQLAIRTIRKIVGASGEMLGSRLALELKTEIPDWDAQAYGSKSLRDFIFSNMDDVIITARSGMDVVYANAGFESFRQPLGTSSTTNLWRIWVSPNSPFYLAVNPETGAVLPVARHSEVPTGHVSLLPPTTDAHKKIAADFLEPLTPERRGQLPGIVKEEDPLWWKRWVKEIDCLGFLDKWNTYRHEELKKLLEATLNDAGLTAVVAAVALKKLVSGSSAKNRCQDRRSSRQEPPEKLSEPLTRAVILDVVQHMSGEELRDLRLPLGLVIDAMLKLKSK